MEYINDNRKDDECSSNNVPCRHADYLHHQTAESVHYHREALLPLPGPSAIQREIPNSQYPVPVFSQKSAVSKSLYPQENTNNLSYERQSRTSLTSSLLVSAFILSRQARANFAIATAWSGLAFGIPQTAT